MSERGAGVRTVDVHAHAVVPETTAVVHGLPGLAAHLALEARRSGSESLAVSRQMIGSRMPQLTDIDVRLVDMDTAGVDVQIVSPSPGQYHYWTDGELATTVYRTANRGIAAIAAEQPDRLGGLGLAPLHHPDRCVAALDDAVGECGLAGVEISSYAPDGAGPDGGTIELSDPRLEPFWARAAELRAVILLHPFGCSLDERLDRFYLSNTVAQPAENAVALSHLIFAGVLDRHDVRIVAAHGGGYLPTYLGRSDHAWQVRPDARHCAETPSNYLRRLWFDSLVYTPDALRALVAAVGADRVVLGSDYPFDMGVQDPVARLAAADLGAGPTAAIAGGNAAALGLLPAPVPT